MIRKKSSILIIGILATAFAAAIYFLFFQGQGGNPGGEGRFSVETVRGEHGWGYVIREDTTAVVEQKFIPGVPGTSGFSTEQDAANTGALVKRKLEQGIFPPTINTHELDSMQVKY
ncbi:MAG: DUF4907 domain-containing protein [Dyadobacter fermentans]